MNYFNPIYGIRWKCYIILQISSIQNDHLFSDKLPPLLGNYLTAVHQNLNLSQQGLTQLVQLDDSRNESIHPISKESNSIEVVTEDSTSLSYIRFIDK